MTEFPSLAEVLADHISEAIIEAAQLREGIGGPSTYEVIQRHAAAAQAAWCEACTISTVEELDTLPDGATVCDNGGLIWQRIDGFADDDHPDGWICVLDGDEPIELPARLTHHPDWPQP